MNDTVDCAFHRIPGLFRRWELATLLQPGGDYHLESAGRADDGTPLLAVYRSSPTDEEDRA